MESLGKFLVLALVVGFVYWSCWGSGDKVAAPRDHPRQTAPAGPPPWSGHVTEKGASYLRDDSPRTGIVWVAPGQDVVLPTDEDAQEAVFAYARAKDEEGFVDLIAAGRVLFVKSGTAVRVTDMGFASHTVEIQEGPSKGLRGIVLMEQYQYD